MTRSLAPLALLPLTVLACSHGSPAPAASDAGANPADMGIVADVVYTAGPFVVDAGSEIVMCTFVQGTNTTDTDVSGFITRQSAGGHHMIVYTLNHPVTLPPVVCPQGGQPGWDYIFGTQDLEDEWQLPAGVGFHIQANQQFAIETHYINATPNTLTVQGAFGLFYAPVGTVTERASVFYFGTENLNMPAQSPWQAQATCSPPDPIEIHAIVGHEHRMGTGVVVGYIPDGGAEQQIYATQQWDSPPMDHLDAGLTVGTGDALHVTCDWDNTSSSAITFPGEMCFAVGAYWPSQAELFCASSGGTDQCYCGYGVPIDTGPGGSTVPVSVTLESGISGFVGDTTDGAPLYCAFYRQQDWDGVQPAADANAYYVDYVTGQSLAAGAAATLTFVDVTPGEYVASCFMDSIAGGQTPGTGDPFNLGGVFFTAVAGDNPAVDVVLDYPVP